MRLLVCFDIVDDKIRRQLSSILLSYGSRCQYSVFELNINSTIFKELQKRIIDTKLSKDDKLFIYPIPFENSANIIRYGPYLKEEDIYVI